MKSKKKFYIILSAIILVLIALIIFRIVTNTSESAKRIQPVPTVVLSIPQRKEMTRNQYFTGDVVPIQQAVIYPRVSGNIEKIFADIGQFVRQGEILALIDTTIYSQNAKQAYASYLQSEANLQNMKLNFDRNKNLIEQKLISQQDLDNSKASYDIAVAQKDFAQANYKNAQTQLGYCRIIAPFSGFITKRFLDAGAYVTASTSQASSTLFILMDLDIVKIITNLPEKQIPFLNSIKEVVVTADALPGKEFKAQIKKMSQAVDLGTRTLAVEIDINNKDHTLKPGMFANINLILERKQNVMALPVEAVAEDDSGSYVFVVAKDTLAHKKYVSTGIKENNMIEIVGGLGDRESVVTIGQNLIKDKLKVRITK